jgi:hypothetical protein
MGVKSLRAFVFAPSSLRLSRRKDRGLFRASFSPYLENARLWPAALPQKEDPMQIVSPFHPKCPSRIWLCFLATAGIVSAQSLNVPPGQSNQPAASPLATQTEANNAAPAATPTPQSPQAAAPPASTNKTEMQASALQPSTIVVTVPTRESQSPDTTATTTSVLTSQYLEESRFVDVASALQLVPGMSTVVSGMPGGQTSVFIHGLDSNQTLVMIDGRRQAVGLSGADDNLANLTLDNVDQIEDCAHTRLLKRTVAPPWAA